MAKLPKCSLVLVLVTKTFLTAFSASPVRKHTFPGTPVAQSGADSADHADPSDRSKATETEMQVGADGTIEFPNRFADLTAESPPSFTSKETHMQVAADGVVDPLKQNAETTDQLLPSVVRKRKDQRVSSDGNIYISRPKPRLWESTCGIRKEIKSWTNEEFEAYAEAIDLLKMRGEWDAWVVEHQSATHGQRGFFEWHNQFLMHAERAIRSIINNECFALPWWNEALDAENPRNSIVFSRIRFGKIGKWWHLWNPDGCIQSIHFAWKPCIERQGMFGLYPVADILQVESIIADANGLDIDVLRAAVEFGDGLHGYVHVAIGGHMANAHVAPYDPVFYLHHAYIDYIRFRANSTGGTFTGSYDDGSLIESHSASRRYVDPAAYPSQNISHKDLDHAVEVCNQNVLAACLAKLGRQRKLDQVPRILTSRCRPNPAERDHSKADEFIKSWDRLHGTPLTPEMIAQGRAEASRTFQDGWPTARAINACDEKVCFLTSKAIELCKVVH